MSRTSLAINIAMPLVILAIIITSCVAASNSGPKNVYFVIDSKRVSYVYSKMRGAERIVPIFELVDEDFPPRDRTMMFADLPSYIRKDIGKHKSAIVFEYVGWPVPYAKTRWEYHAGIVRPVGAVQIRDPVAGGARAPANALPFRIMVGSLIPIFICVSIQMMFYKYKKIARSKSTRSI